MILELLGILVLVLLGLIVYARWNFGWLEKEGLQVVPYHWLLGSTHDMHKHVTHLRDYDWFKKYGPVFGVYEGRSPQVFVCDAELVRQIFVKDFDHFRERREIDFGDPIANLTLDFLHPYDKWKAVRSAITPMFSSSRVKKMSVVVGETLTDYVNAVNEDIRAGQGKIEKFNLFFDLFNMLCDMMARTIFSLKVDNRRDPDNFLTKTLAGFFADSNLPEIVHSIALSFPILRKIAPMISSTSSASFKKLFTRVVAERRASGVKKDDLVDQLINLIDQIDTTEFKRIGVDMDTIMAQAVIFFMAGPDQFAVVTTCLALFLSQNPEKLEKLQKELDRVMEKSGGQIGHEQLGDLVYTNACVTEALRIFPPFIRPERICTKDWESNGIKIKKGMTVMLPLYAANRNPEYFEDPDSFVPERWLPENKAKLHHYAFMTFGHGPRNCIASRMSQEVLPMIVANIFSKFEFKLRPDTKLNYKKRQLIILNFEPIYFDVVPRNKVRSMG